MKKHLKYIDENSDKFWQIEVSNNEFTVTYGKNGTSGTSQTKSFDSNENCIKAAEKLLAEKIKKGYSENGQVIISDKVDAKTGIITTVAGIGTQRGFSGDNDLATKAPVTLAMIFLSSHLLVHTGINSCVLDQIVHFRIKTKQGNRSSLHF